MSVFAASRPVGTVGRRWATLLSHSPPALVLFCQGTFGQGGYGFKASEKLSKVRGKDFRHEKTKKKRGSYRGGEISMNSYSVKFDDSDG